MFRSPAAAPLILLVDDDPYQAEVASYIAYELGCDFESALSGTEALEKVDARRPDVVLLDVRMPDLSGYEVCRRIKTAPETAGTQVIFVTARTEEEDLLQGFEALANDYVTKPFSARELKARVKNALRVKSLARRPARPGRGILELQQEITDRASRPRTMTVQEMRARVLVPILDRIAAVFGADGVTLHLRRPGHPELHASASTTWPGGEPPAYLAALALDEDPRLERAPRIAGDARDSGDEWTVAAAPLWAGRELIGTLRLHRRGPTPAPGASHELEHLVDFSGHLGRALSASRSSTSCAPGPGPDSPGAGFRRLSDLPEDEPLLEGRKPVDEEALVEVVDLVAERAGEEVAALDDALVSRARRTPRPRPAPAARRPRRGRGARGSPPRPGPSRARPRRPG